MGSLDQQYLENDNTMSYRISNPNVLKAEIMACPMV